MADLDGGERGGAVDDGALDGQPKRGVARAMLRGSLGRCPACGRGRLYGAYLAVVGVCPACGEALHHHRADDAPPYATIFVVGHLIVAAVVGIDIAYAWPLWLHAAVWGPATVALCLSVLPVVKGALVGLQWALRMHGFGDASDEPDAHPASSESGRGRPGRLPGGR